MTASGKAFKQGIRSSQLGRRQRYEPTSMYALAEYLRSIGVDVRKSVGLWRPTRRPLRRPGRNADLGIPIVTNGRVEIAVDTAEHAVDLSGVLNSTGLVHIDPAQNLRPPAQDLAT